MSSRSRGGAILFLVLLLGIGLYVAFQSQEPAPSGSQTASATGDAAPASDESGVAPAPEAVASGDVDADASAHTGSESADAGAGAADTAGADGPATGDQADASATTATASTGDKGSDEAGSTPGGSTPVETTVTTMELETPSYDIVRVEPSGDAVIAGRASPGATIVLEANGKVIGKTVANASGEWVIVLEEPLQPGDYDIAVRSSHDQAAEEKASVERLAVSIPQNRTETPLVAVTRPNAPDTVIQKPQPAATQVASTANTESDTAATAAGADGTSASETGTAASGEPSPDAAQETVIGTLKVREETVTEPAGEPAGAPTQPQSGTPAAGGDDASGSTGTTATAAAVSDTAATDTSAAAPAAMLPVSIESAEADTGHFRVSGTSEPGTDVWIYLDGAFVGEATAGDDGRWTFEAEMAFERGQSSIRVDQVTDAKGSVEARAEVPFGYRQAREEAVASAPAGEPPEVEVVGETEEGVRVLIRRGDNLWTVARHFYGDGFSYTSIYQANDEQIRNPHLIYPGQVFTLPGLSRKDVTGEAKRRAL